MSTVAKLTREEIKALVMQVIKEDCMRLPHEKHTTTEAEQKLIDAGLLNTDGSCIFSADAESDFAYVADLFDENN